MSDNVEKLDISPYQSLQRALAEHTGEDCLLWERAKNYSGYGVFKHNEKRVRAHRVAYEEAFGPIPEGMIVRHKCDVRDCINPNHLELGTQADNMKDMYERHRGAPSEKRARVGEANGMSKLTESCIPFIRMTKGLITQTRLSELFLVDRKVIYDIQKGKIWNHV